MKEKKSTIRKIVEITFLVLIGMVLLFVLGVFIYHKVQLGRELSELKEHGYVNLVSVGDHSLNVAIFGKKDGDHTIVGLAGLGISDYSVTGRKMTEVLEERNAVVFVDRAGFGLSEDTSDPMTLQTIVEEYRLALRNAGLPGPYILMPHSIGGAYATWWCSRYPEEIEGVVFIDGSQLSEGAFAALAGEEEVSFHDKFSAFLTRAGFRRFTIDNYLRNYSSVYSPEEQKLGQYLTIRTQGSIAPLSETNLIYRNTEDAFSGIVTNDVPKLYICASWGADTDKSRELRENYLQPYLDKMGNCQLALLPGSHMIYEEKPYECGDLIEEFIDGLEA